MHSVEQVPGKSIAVIQEGGSSRRFEVCIAALFFFCVLITRLPTFFRSVMDWDESLYFLIAEQWRAGHLPYTTIWDNKPIGIYGIFALFQSVFGDHVASIRIASVLVVTVTAFTVFKIALLVPPNPSSSARLRITAALFAGIAYVVCSLSNDGLAANTEIFMVCFTSLAMLCALSRHPFAAGLLFGMAFMTKYVAIFEFPAIAFSMIALTPRANFRAVIKSCFGLLSGCALPLLLIILLYAAAGHLQPWWEDSILSNVRRVAVPVSMQGLTYVLNMQLVRWSPLFIVSFVMLATAGFQFRRSWRSKNFVGTGAFHVFLALWLAGGCIGVASAKSFFDHYFLQILPVMCVTLAWALIAVAPVIRAWPRYATGILFAAVLVIPIAAAATALGQAASPILAIENGRIILQPDTPAKIAREIRPLLIASAANQIFVFDYQPIIYSLAGQVPPTKYAFPSVLTKCQLADVAEIPATEEISRILTKNPEFIIRSRYPATDPSVINLHVYAELDRTIAARYVVWRTYDDAIIYRLSDPNGAVNFNFGSLPAACPKAAQ